MSRRLDFTIVVSGPGPDGSFETSITMDGDLKAWAMHLDFAEAVLEAKRNGIGVLEKSLGESLFNQPGDEDQA